MSYTSQEKELLEAQGKLTIDDFYNKINESFTSLLILTEYYVNGNNEFIKILNEVENGG